MNLSFRVLLVIGCAFAKSLPNGLILTPLINSGNIESAQKQALVNSRYFNNLQSYSGFFTVNQTYDSNLFFWYFPPIYARTNAAVVLWLQGGPGASSLYGLFSENGPFYVNKNGELKPNKYTWNNEYHLIYIDNPVGTGFSYTNHPEGYAQTEEEIGNNLYEAMLQFFKLFPILKQHPFYITGESYAGKYIPALAYQIFMKKKINLKGMAIGNGTPDPYNQVYTGDYLYQLGLIDKNQRNHLLKLNQEFRKLVEQDLYSEASQRKNEIQQFFFDSTNFTTRYNYMKPNFFPDKYWILFLIQPKIRGALHVGLLPFTPNGEAVYAHLFEDTSKSVAPWIEILIPHYPIMFYNGQLDIVSPYPVMANVIEHFNFSSAKQFAAAKRCVWSVNGTIAGYFKRVDNLIEVLVREAGHLVPHDQPAWALDLISKFVDNKLVC